MRDLNIPLKGMKIKEATAVIGKAFGKKPWEMKKAFKKLEDSSALKIMRKKGSFGTFSKKQVEQLFKDTKEKSGFYYSKTKALKAFNEVAEKGNGESVEDKKKRLIKYSKKRERMSERLKEIKTGRLIDSKTNSESNPQDKIKEKRDERVNRVRNIKIAANQNQNQYNPNTAANPDGGWTVDGQENNLNDKSSEQDGGEWTTNEGQVSKSNNNSKGLKKDVSREEQPLDMFID
ncbi:MAG: hypothetical protein U9O66_02345 [Patescibacteria group bacterium]|nr:hypothetical protein [Patescibacteria group bacterium]